MARLRAGARELLEGNAESCAVLLEEAERNFEASKMALHAAATRWRLGEVIGGDQGRDLIQRAASEIASLGARRPASMVRMLTPDFPE